MDMARFIGTHRSNFPGDKTEPLYYRMILKSKDDSIKCNNENFNAKLILIKGTLHEAKWWERNTVKWQLWDLNPQPLSS